MLTQFNDNDLDQLTENNTIACSTSETPSTSPKPGRPAGDLAVFWKTSDTITFLPFMIASRVMGLKVQTISNSFVMLNIYLCCDDTFPISLHEFQSSSQNISNFITEEPFDDIFITGDFNADPFKGRFSIYLKVRC